MPCWPLNSFRDPISLRFDCFGLLLTFEDVVKRFVTFKIYIYDKFYEAFLATPQVKIMCDGKSHLNINAKLMGC